MNGTIDPLGLPRCSKCQNAFENERNRDATASIYGDPDGEKFICNDCAELGTGMF